MAARTAVTLLPRTTAIARSRRWAAPGRSRRDTLAPKNVATRSRQSPAAMGEKARRASSALHRAGCPNLTGARGAHHALLTRLTRPPAYAKGSRDFPRFDPRGVACARARALVSRLSRFRRPRLPALTRRGRATCRQPFGQRRRTNQLSPSARGLVFRQHQRAPQARA